MSIDGGGGRNSDRISKKRPQNELDMEQFMDADVAKEFGMTPDEVEFVGDGGRSKVEAWKRMNEREAFAMEQYDLEVTKLHKSFASAAPQKRVERPAFPVMVVKKKEKANNINIQLTEEDEEDEPDQKKQKVEPEGLGDLMGDFDLMAPDLEEAGDASSSSDESATPNKQTKSAATSAESAKAEPELVKEPRGMGAITGYASDSDDSDDSAPGTGNLLNPLA
eukprot:gnl/MRDRNA2_/MRDRNA2_53932_c0_seq1.p1 gnl/MRDRNA2_/MRDRNA2_53932_c0~~gnl/MRDRNA2_/MRDRNA2_53932_c0_seq1.p1  ORF type:complete len:247 (+),score=74.95 gnl/MRDRNA2_/MRDRNA2_53932_c0_seq1:76-741(+)